MLDYRERRNRIIESIVSSFIRKAQPVGSEHVARTCGLGLSSATIRNVMKELEDEGYLAQPHTSAGRIPTIKCYRYFVKYIMPEIAPLESEIREAKQLIENALREHDADIFMSHIAKVLSEVTDLIGVAMSPSFEQGLFNRLEIVSLGGSAFLVVITLDNGIVKTINLTVDRIIPRIKVDETARLITGRLNGLTVAEIKRTIGERLKGVSGGDRRLFDVILRRYDDIFSFTEANILHVAGLSRLLVQPEFILFDNTLKLIDLYEHKNEIAKVLNGLARNENEVNIKIGGSGLLDSKLPLSLVSAVYAREQAHGAVAVLGPTRIDYPRLAAIVRFTAQVATHYFTDS